MKIAVMGAGAVGCYYGAMLARAGHSVTLVGRQQRVTAVQAHGLILEAAGRTEAVPVDATTDPSGVAGADVVLFCVKANDTLTAGRIIASHLGSSVPVLSLQNGVDSAEHLQAVLGRPIVPAAVYVAVDMPAPAHVRHHGRGELVIGPGPSSVDIAEVFSRAGIATEVSENVKGVLWAKLIVNCAYNALSAVAQLPYGQMMKTDSVPETMRDIVAECLAVAERSNVMVPEEIISSVLGLAASMPDQLSSTAQDIAQGKESEIDHLNGYIVRAAARLGIAAPVNRALLVMVRLVEAKALIARR